MKYFLHLAYNGTAYKGWQRQVNVLTVQEVIEDKLHRMLGYFVPCIGCGRTDAGVHASQFFCQIILQEALTYDPIFRLNKMLPEDIAIFDFIPVTRQAQAQFDALERTYTYHIHGIKNPFLSTLSTYYPMEGLSVEKMKAAATLLIGERDFLSFCKQPAVYKTTVCQVSAATISQTEKNKLQFTISANRFLRGMVRLVVGNLLAVGYGELTMDLFEKAIKEQAPLPYFRMAYPQGLYLSKVRYDFLDM